jgi:hypothetical protein
LWWIKKYGETKCQIIVTNLTLAPNEVAMLKQLKLRQQIYIFPFL